MINDSERREIAARLRELADANEGCLGMDRVNRVLRDGQAILGTSGLASVADVLRRHADLIEPDERTCRMTLKKSGPFYDVWQFDCCEKEWAEPRCDNGVVEYPGIVCPYCGAKVIANEQ